MILINKTNGEKIDLAEYDDIGYMCDPNQKNRKYIVCAYKDFHTPHGVLKEIKTLYKEADAQAFCNSIRNAIKSGDIQEYAYSSSDSPQIADIEYSLLSAQKERAAIHRVKVRKVKPSASAVPRLKECGDGYDVYRRRYNAAIRKVYIKIMYR